MAEQRTKVRIINKHATEAVWKLATTFVPLQAETIVYDADYNADTNPNGYKYERFKIGDGKTTVDKLPFVSASHADTAGVAESAKKLTTFRTITLDGAVGGAVDFDGSKNVTIETNLKGRFTAGFTGYASSHKHTFNGSSGEAVASYTPSGKVTTKFTPIGIISAPNANVTTSTDTTNVVTNPGTQPTYTQGSCEFPTLDHTYSDLEAVLKYEGGKYTPGVLTPGADATYKQITYLTDVGVTVDAPRFEGEESTVEGEFKGTTATITSTYTPSGTITETSTTPDGEVVVSYSNQ